MVLEDALEMLNPARNVGGANAPDLWRPDAAAPFDPTQFPPSQPRFPQQMPFAPPVSPFISHVLSVINLCFPPGTRPVEGSQLCFGFSLDMCC